MTSMIDPAMPLGATSLPVPNDDAPPPVPRSGLRAANPEDRFTQIGSWAGGFALSWVITQRLLPAGGLTWFLIVGFVMGVVITGITAAMTGSAIEVRDRVATAFVTAGTLIVGFALASTLIYVFKQGYKPLLHWNFFFEDSAGVGPRDPFTKGGILHAIVGSLIQVGIATVITIPLGIGTAVFMTEIGGKFAKVVRTVVEAMTALPSIVAGLFIYTVMIIGLGFPRSGICAAFALGVMMLPIIARAADVVLRVVPGGLREASLALGASRWKTVWHVVLPTARPGLATALILGIARGIGETSPVLLTSGAASFLVTNPTDGVMNSLPLYIYSTVRSGEPIAIERAFGAASVLLILVLVLFVIARALARQRTTKPSRVSGLVQRMRDSQ
ncbi:phosphate transport system permease protein [Marmoricola sp. OAE513]|uniref:phosphate ABC transporter permease PstA n=1 Tax=Marmoricola sp. OAE513 TaxID=2817894 RepID=UPI001AE60D3C